MNQLKEILGVEKLQDIPALFLWLGDDEEEAFNESSVTWYDARERNPDRSEFRLYFKPNRVMQKASEGDLLFVAKKPSGDLSIFVTGGGSSAENRLLWLFGLTAPEVANQFSVKQVDDQSDRKIEFISRFVLEEMGIVTSEPNPEELDDYIKDFKNTFPTTEVFSRNARLSLPDVDARDDPDKALLAWLEHEERLFRHLEKKIVAKRLEKGFHDGMKSDVDAFISYSLSVQNRRKSRAGYAVEHHLDEIFRTYGLRYERQAKTEEKSRPDFLFPGALEYHDNSVPESKLSMLGVKSSCKERWRQVLAEAKRIQRKHLLTLEPGISENQTSQMESEALQLVLPAELHSTYSAGQQSWLMSLRDFINYIKKQQSRQK